jgi:outer membrane lipoprotein SlyB
MTTPCGLQIRGLALVALLSGCATTQTTTTTWTAPNAYSYTRSGQVEAVQEVVRRTEGQPVLGALTGALVGGALFGGPGSSAGVVGAAGGAAVGAAASQGSSESRTYNVIVRFDDGGHSTFVYGDYSPFRPGERVVLTPQGLSRG